TIVECRYPPRHGTLLCFVAAGKPWDLGECGQRQGDHPYRKESKCLFCKLLVSKEARNDPEEDNKLQDRQERGNRLPAQLGPRDEQGNGCHSQVSAEPPDRRRWSTEAQPPREKAGHKEREGG